MTQGYSEDQQDIEITTIKDVEHPLMKNPIETLKIRLPPKGKSIGLSISRCEFHNLPYISKSSPTSLYYKAVKTNLRHNVWILAVGNNDPISVEQAFQDLKDLQIVGKINTIQIVISKRDVKEHVRTTIGERWASFDQMRMIKM